MIKFFRRIRQNLLLAGNTGKYLKYAFGEIILVMIGILLALQVNNWNNNNKDRELKIQYLKRLQADLNVDIESLEFHIPRLTEKQIALKKVKEMIITDTQVPSDTLEQILEKSTWLAISIRIKRQNTTYSELVSSGNLRLIRNIDLRDDISQYYTLWENNILRVDKSVTGYRSIVHQMIDPGKFWGESLEVDSLNELLEKYELKKQYLKLLNEEATFSEFVDRRLKQLLTSAKTLKKNISIVLKNK